MTPRAWLAAALWIGLAACGGRRAGSPPPLDLGTAWLQNGPLVAADEPLRVAFAAPLAADPAAAAAAAVLRPRHGAGLGAPVHGAFALAATNPGGALDQLHFVPELPVPGPQPQRAGLVPGTDYELEIAGGEATAALRFATGERLPRTLRFAVRTRDLGDPQAFASQRPGGPRLQAAVPSPASGEAWAIGRLAAPAELVLRFDQPLDPRPANLPAESTAAAPGPLVLRYDDPERGPDALVPCAIELEANTVAGAVVVLRPHGVLPSAALVRLWVAPTLRDLHGDDRQALGEPAAAGAWQTEAALAPRADAVELRFDRPADLGDPAFPEVPAVVADGALRADDPFAAAGEIGDVRWTGEVVLSTARQVLRYTDGREREFHGGELHLRNLHLAAGAVVRAIGPRPLVLVVHGEARIDGRLSVDGSTSPRQWYGQYGGPFDYSPPPPGGALPPHRGLPAATPVVAARGGAAGGDAPGVPPRHRLLQGQPLPGGDAVGGQGTGGSPGQLACQPCRLSSGGGGGAMATQGDPWYPAPALPGLRFPQRSGQGGFGCANRDLPGGAAGRPVVDAADSGDDFWGRAYEPRTGRHRRGELGRPVGGGAGGMPGLFDEIGCDPEAPFGFTVPHGGGGGGVVVVKARGRLTIGPHGRISADGGHGRWFVSWSPLAGAGGGAGGMVVLMTGDRLVLHTHGETFADGDYDFAVSADGGWCSPGSWNGAVGKYPANGIAVMLGAEYDVHPLGGFGGLGIVQFMVPVGRDNADGTNTVLDDAIDVVQNGVALQGSAKQRYLAWRGWPDESGTWLDDFGVPTGTAGGQGDIRPAPVLLPAPYAVDGRARARSRWLSLGARARRPLTAPDGAARGVLGDGLQFGAAPTRDGWQPFTSGLAATLGGPAVLPAPLPVVAAAAATSFAGGRAHRLELAAPGLGAVETDRYVGYLAELRDATGPREELRVLGHDATTVWVATAAPLPTDFTHLQLRATFAEFDQQPGGYVDHRGQSVPRANAQLGFAFHRAPDRATAGGYDPDRYPADPRQFLRDLGDPAVVEALRAFGPTHVQWDALLDGRHAPDPRDRPPAEPVRLGLRRFFLPVRF